jgi:hypothetical protein
MRHRARRPAAPARAQLEEERDPGDGSIDTSFAIYADDDATTVVTSMVSGDVVAGRGHRRRPRPDRRCLQRVRRCRVAATPRWTENRVELGATAARRFGGVATQLGYATSGENDWRSHAVTLRAARALAHDNATLQLLQLHRQPDRPRPHPGFERSLEVHAAELGLTQVLGPRTLGTIAYTVQRAKRLPDQPVPLRHHRRWASRCRDPPHRPDRHAVTARVMRVLGERTTADGSYRSTSTAGASRHTPRRSRSPAS